MASLIIPTKGLPDWAIIAIGAIVAVLVIAWMKRNKKSEEVVVARWQMPEEVSPLSITHLLRQIEQEQALLDSKELISLQTEVAAIETQYFSEGSNKKVDIDNLKSTAQQWISRTKQ